MRKIAIPSHPNHANNWPAQDRDFKQLFGLRPEAKWPEQGMNNADGSTMDVFVQGDFGKVRLWVNPYLRPWPYKRSKTHRVQCICPVCGAVMSAGRLQQHCNHVHSSPQAALPYKQQDARDAAHELHVDSTPRTEPGM